MFQPLKKYFFSLPKLCYHMKIESVPKQTTIQWKIRDFILCAALVAGCSYCKKSDKQWFASGYKNSNAMPIEW